jgi:DNA-binding transcriptional ArsR family regulator
VAQHLAVLEECGLVKTQKVGRVRTCRIESAGFDALQGWIAEHRTLWERRLDAIGDVLDDDA